MSAPWGRAYVWPCYNSQEQETRNAMDVLREKSTVILLLKIWMISNNILLYM